jgi:Fungal Zn(2)-Cys(6) binuclear cluster domain
MSGLSARALPRKALACTLCRNRKVKCSGEIPCQGCRARGVECVYIDGKKRGPPLGYVRVKKRILNANAEENEQLMSPVLPAKIETIPFQSYNIPDHGYSDVNQWDHVFFRQLTFEDEDGSRLPFIDYYFKWAHRELPFLSKDWIDENFHLLPPYFLHAM